MEKRYTITDDDGRHYVDIDDVDSIDLLGRIYGPAVERLAQYEDQAEVEPRLAADHFREAIIKIKEMRREYYRDLREALSSNYRQSKKWWKKTPKVSLWENAEHTMIVMDKIIETLEEYYKALAQYSTKENPD